MASLQSVVDGESNSIALHSDEGQSSALNVVGSEVTPNEDETVEEFVFRILGQKILKMLIMNIFSSSSYSHFKKKVLSYRAVCRAWRDNIHLICFNVGFPLFHFPFIQVINGNVVKERLSEKIEKFSSLLASSTDSSVPPPVELDLDFTCPPYFLDKKSEVDGTFFNSLRKIESNILSVWLILSPEFQQGNDWASLNMENLNSLTFSWRGPSTTTTETDIYSNVPEFTLSKSLQKLDIFNVKPPMWLIDGAPTLVNLKELFLRTEASGHTKNEAADPLETLLIANLAKSLERLQFDEECHRVQIYNPKPLELPVAFSIIKPMQKLNSLEICLKNGRVGELQGYKEFLPSLVNLSLSGFRGDLNFPASWYASPCLTMRRLSICSDIYGRDDTPLGEKVLVALSKSFRNLKELTIGTTDFEGNNWQAVLCQGFPNLSKLAVSCSNVPTEGRNRLVAAVSGIPLEELEDIFKNEKVLEDAMSKYKHYPSLRDMSNLQELTLNVCNRYEGLDAVKTDSSVMIYSTFIRMPTLKWVKLNKSFQRTHEIIKDAREKTGLIIENS